MVSADDVELRRFRGDADIAGMTALINARTVRDGHGEYLSPDTLAERYRHLVRCDPVRDMIVAELGGDVVGYARTTWEDTGEGDRNHWLAFEADPAIAGLQDVLLDWVEAAALDVATRAVAPTSRLVAAAPDGSDRNVALAERGFVPLRYGRLMVRPHLEDISVAALPDGVEIRPVTAEHLRAIFDADNVAFRDEWGNVEQTAQDYLAFREGATSGTGTSLWQIAWAGEEVVGQVRTFADDGDRQLWGRRRAWTENISTVRGWRGRGVATAVIAASLRQLAELGYEEAALSVDSENPSGALGLYESLGYVAVATDVMLQRPITR